MEVAEIIQSARSLGVKTRDRVVASGERGGGGGGTDGGKVANGSGASSTGSDPEVEKQLLNLQEVFRAALAQDEDEASRARTTALVRERDHLVTSGVLGSLLKQLKEKLASIASRSGGVDAKGLVHIEVVLLAECIFLLCYTVQVTREEAIALRSCASQVAAVGNSLEGSNGAAGISASAGAPAADATASRLDGSGRASSKVDLSAIGHLLFLSWSCCLDRSRYRDTYDPRMGRFDVNALLRDEQFIKESREELDPELAAFELVACVFRLATANPDEETDAVTIPLRVCVGERGALHYLGRELPHWLSFGSAVLAPDLLLYTDALEDLAIDVAEAPTLCSVLVDFTQEAANAAAANVLTEGGEIPQFASIRSVSATRGSPADSVAARKLTTNETSNMVAALATFFAEAVSLSPGKVGSFRSVNGGLRYLSGANAGGGVLQRLGDAVIDLGDTAMRDPDAPGGVGAIFSAALLQFLDFMRACAGVSVPYAAALMRYLTEAGHSMASLDRLQAAVNFYTQALEGDVNAVLNPAESMVLAALLSVVTTCASTLYGQGDLLAVVGIDFPMRIAALAVLEVPPHLKAAAVDALVAFSDAAGISAYLESATADRCSGLSKEINTIEAAVGVYAVTTATLKLCVKVLREMVNKEELDRGAIPTVVESVVLFGLDQVLAHWSRREYRDEVERWKVAAEAATLIYESRRSTAVLSHLLQPAPGAGSPSPALRALAAIAGLRRNADGEGGSSTGLSGASALAKAASDAQGRVVKLMERSSVMAAKVLQFVLSVSPDQLRRMSRCAISAGDLLSSEHRSVVATSSLIDGNSVISAPAAAYFASLVAVAPALATMVINDPTAPYLRQSLAAIVAGTADADDQAPDDEEGELPGGADDGRKPSAFDSVLRLIAACQSKGGAPEAAYYLLGLSPNEGDEYVHRDGVLGGLCDRLRRAARFDESRVATAAGFLAALAGSPGRHLSEAVLRFLHTDIAGGGSCAGTTLARVLTEVHPNDREDADRIRWNDLARLIGACMRIVALESLLYPDEQLDSDALSERGSALLALLRLVARITRSVDRRQLAVDAFSSWRQLLSAGATRLHQDGRLNSATIYEITSELLGGVAGGADTDMEHLVQAEGAAGAANVILLCVSLLREPVSEELSVDLSQAGSILERTVRALTGPLGSQPDGQNSRTALYAALMHSYQLVESFRARKEDGVHEHMERRRANSDGRADAVDLVLARAMQASMGQRKWSGAEGVCSVSAEDACTGSAAVRAAAMSALACVLKMDAAASAATGGALTALQALSAQKRLQKIMSSALGNPDAAAKISQLCNGGVNKNLETAADVQASVYVAESAFSLLHAIANTPSGARAIADAGAIESVAFLAATLATGRAPELRSLSENGSGGRQALKTDMSEAGDDPPWLETQSAAETQSILLGMIAGVTAASLRKRGGASLSDSMLAAPAMAVVEAGQVIFAELLRGVRDASISQLEAASAVCLLLCRLSADFMNVGAASLLVNLCARFVWSIFPPHRDRMWSGGEPRTAKEARRAKVTHPEGASLFERDLAFARMRCARVATSAVRSSPALLTFFSPSVVTSRDDSNARLEASLGDVVETIKIVLGEMNRATEEEMRITANLSGASRRLPALRAYCLEEFGVQGAKLSGDAVERCMKKTAEKSRMYVEQVCAAVVESLLFILREYAHAARETTRGLASASTGMSEKDAEMILVDGRNTLLSTCREVDASLQSSWGRRDIACARQLSRQLRTLLTEK